MRTLDDSLLEELRKLNRAANIDNGKDVRKIECVCTEKMVYLGTGYWVLAWEVSRVAPSFHIKGFDKPIYMHLVDDEWSVKSFGKGPVYDCDELDPSKRDVRNNTNTYGTTNKRFEPGKSSYNRNFISMVYAALSRPIFKMHQASYSNHYHLSVTENDKYVGGVAPAIIW